MPAHCGNKKEVIKLGTNRSGTSGTSGTARCRCLTWGRTFTPAPKSRALTLQKQAAIEGSRAQRVWQQGIAPMLKGGRDTMRRVRQKGHRA